MFMDEAQLRKERASGHLPDQLPNQTSQKGVQLTDRKAKRPQLRRLQHDDPFDGADMLALDDVRSEEPPVQ